MQSFELKLPTRIIFGKGRHREVGSVIKEYGYRKVLFVYGGSSIKRTGLYGEIAGALRENALEFFEISGVQANPTLQFCREAIKKAEPFRPDFVLAVGGGRVIDTAKMMANSLAMGGDLNRPLFAIMNPELTYTLPKYQLACGIVDIMLHTMERYIALDGGDNDLTDRMAEGLLKAVIRAGEMAYANHTDWESHATLMLAGSWSHNGMMEAGRKHNMPAHTLEHGLSGLDDKIAHGAGLAIIWPAFLKFIHKYDRERFIKYAVRIWNCEMDYRSPERTVEAGIRATEDYFASLGMPLRLREVGVTEKDIPAMVEKATKFGTRTVDSLIPLGAGEIAEIYRLCL